MEARVVGVDTHARTLTAVAVDELGRPLQDCTVRNDRGGHARLRRWAEGGQPCRWVVEGAGGYGRVLAQALVRSGAAVYGVPGWVTARTRRHGRRPDKSDRQDALAVARAWLREPGLPAVYPEQASTALRLLLDERDALVKERTRWRQRLRAALRVLGAEADAAVGSLTGPAGLRRALALSLPGADVVDRVRQEQVHRIAAQLVNLDAQVTELQRQIRKLLGRIGTSLQQIPGCGPLNAARLLAETGDAARFAGSEAAFARFCGTAPRQASSGQHIRHRLDRRGNRTLNATLHRIALTQLRIKGSAGHNYIQQRCSEGKTQREAMRALKRLLARKVFRTMNSDLKTGVTTLNLT